MIAGLLTLAAVVCVSRLHADTSLEALFARNDPAAVAMGQVFKNFSSVEELLILATTPRPQADPAALEAFARRLETAVKADPQASRLATKVIWRADPETRQFFEKVLIPNATLYLDNASFAAAIKRLDRDEIFQQISQDRAMLAAPGPAAQGLSKLVLLDPLRLHEFIVNRLRKISPIKTYKDSTAFLSPDGRSILIRIPGRRPVSDLQFSKDFTAAIERIAGAVNADHLQLAFTGSYPIAAASAKGIRSDMIGSVVGSVLMLQGLFFLAYRRPIRSFLLAFLPVATGILWGFAAYELLGATLTPISAVIGGILGGMAIDYSIQFLSHYDSFKNTGAESPSRLTLKNLWPALFAAWITSVIGFAAIGFANVKALRDFSLLGSLGLTGAFLAALFVLPSFLAVADRSRNPMQRLNARGLLQVIGRYRLALFLCATVIFAGAAIILALPGTRLSLATDLSAMHPHPNPPLEAQAQIVRRMGSSPQAMIIYLHARSPDQLLTLSHAVQNRLDTPGPRSAGVTSTFGLAALLPDPVLAQRRIKQIDPALAGRVAENLRAALRQNGFNPSAFAPYIDFLNHLLTNRSIPGMDALLPYRSLAETILPKSAFIRGQNITTAVTYVFLSTPSESRIARDTAIDAIRSALKDLPGATITGLGVLAHDAQLNVQRQLPKLVIVGVGAIALFLLILFRNPVDCLLAIIPMFFSLVILLAYMRIANAGVDMINLVALPLLIGIDVDYGVFIVSSVRKKTRAGLSADELPGRIAPSLAAVLLCAAATILGFASLIFTSVPAVRSLGILVSIGIIACVAGVVFLVLPIVFWMNGPGPAAQRKQAQVNLKDRV